jgi:hypothetical protein
MVDMGNNAKITNVVHSRHFFPEILGGKGKKEKRPLWGRFSLSYSKF